MISGPVSGLLVNRARVFGAAAAQKALEAGLEHCPIADVLPADEILFIPQLKAKIPLSPLQAPSRFGVQLADQLRCIAHDAMVDPSGKVDPALPLRFRNPGFFIAWLLGIWLIDGSARSQATIRIICGDAGIEHWQRRNLLNDARLLVSAIYPMVVAGIAGDWIRRLDQQDIGVVWQALILRFPLPDHLMEDAKPFEEKRAVPFVKSKPDAVRQEHHQKCLGATMLTELQEVAVAIDRHGNQLMQAPNASARLLLTLVYLSRSPSRAHLLTTDMLQKILDIGSKQPHLDTTPTQTPIAPQPDATEPHGPPTQSQRLYRKNQGISPQIASSDPFVAPFTVKTGVAETAKEQAHWQDASSIRQDRGDEPISKIETGFGGILFLVNALLALGLYPDFSRPVDTRLEPSPLWLIDKIAARLFGKSYLRDPLHRWLADNSLPGPLPEIWQVQPEWLERIPRTDFGVRRSQSRTIFWDSRGFALYDGTLLKTAAQHKLVRHFGFAGTYTDALGRLPKRSMPKGNDARWIACLAEFLMVRMNLACDGLNIEALRIPAKLIPRVDRIDCHYGLAELRIEIRLAGLDRNPGWLPAEGRSMTFHFS